MTLKEIAQKAGVSRGTIDRVIKNRGGVNAETEKRVRKILEESGYTPNRAGVALVRSKRPMVVGVITNSIGNPFFDEVNKGVEQAFSEYRDYGFTLLRKEIKGYDVDEQLSAMQQLFDSVDGLILTPINDIKIISKIKEYAINSKPVITVTADVDNSERVQYVGCDYFKSGQTAANLMSLALLKKGKIAVVTGSFKMLGHNDRIRGFKNVCEKSGLDITAIVECNDDDIAAYSETEKLLKSDIDGIYIAAAGVAGTVKAVKESGKNILLVANDAIPSTVQFVKTGIVLATIDQQPITQGYTALKNMFDILLGGLPESEYFHTDLAIKMKYNI